MKKVLLRTRWLKRILLRFKLVPKIEKVQLPDGFEIFVNARDLYGPSFYILYDRKKGFETYELNEKLELLSAFPPGKSDGSFLDIGGNIGLFALFFAKFRPDVQVHCFEPEDNAFTCINMTKCENDLSNLHVHNLAISSSEGNTDLFIDEKNFGGHSMHENAISTQNKIVRKVSKSLTTVDNFVQNQNIKNIKAIKIDVQNHEKDVIKGALKSIIKYNPLILVEINTDELSVDNYLFEFLGNKTGAKYLAKDLKTQKCFSLDELKMFCKENLKRGVSQLNLLLYVD